METIKVTEIYDARTENTYTLRPLSDYAASVTVSHGKGEDYAEFMFKLKTDDMQELAKHMAEFAKAMELERLSVKQ